MAKGWKKAAEVLLSRSGVPALAERHRGPQRVILAYHNIVPRGERAIGERSLHIDQATFADQLDWLLERRTVIPLERARHHPGDAVGEGEEADGGDPQRTEIVITFDDAYRGAMTAGMEELVGRDLPSTVFVPTGLLGSDGFWWDRIAPAGGGPLDPLVRRHALEHLGGRTPEVLAWAKEEALAIQDLPEHARPVTEVELMASMGSKTTLAAHTSSHPNLTGLTPNEVHRELSESRAWVENRTDRFVDWLAYPYGMVDDVAAAVAADLFDGALLVDGGAAVIRGRSVGTLHRTPRINVPRGLSLDGLRLRLAGIL